MRIPIEIRKKLGNQGTKLENVSHALPHFVDFMIEKGFSCDLLGVRKDILGGWKSKITGENAVLNVKAGTLIAICDAVNVYPHKAPRLPCIGIEHGRRVWLDFERLWRQRFPDDRDMWSPSGEPLFDTKEFSQFLSHRGLKAPSEVRELHVDEQRVVSTQPSATVNQSMIKWVSANEAMVTQFIDDHRLLETATQIDLYLYTGETTIRAWRQLLFDRIKYAPSKPLMIRLLIRDPDRDERKRSQIEGTLDAIAQIERQEGSQIKTDVRYFAEDPTFRLYFFTLPESQMVCLAGFYHYDENNWVRFVGAENSRLIVLNTNNEAERTAIRQLHGRFHHTWETSDVQAVIFDMDGVLVDGMPHHLTAWLQAFVEAGITFDEDDFKTEVYLREGEKVDVTAAQLYAKYAGGQPREEHLQQILTRRESLHTELTRDAHPMGGIYELLDFLRERRLPLAVVTGSTRQAATVTINRLFPDRFDVIVTGDDTDCGKPDPMPYQVAVEKLGVGAASCLVLENAPFGVRSASSAGLRVYGVLLNSPLSEDDLKSAGAERVFASHAEVEKVVRSP